MTLDRRQLLAWGGALAAGQVAAQPNARAGRSAQVAVGAGPRRIGLALGSGSARGFAHIGVLQALDEAGITASAVAGTSAGSLVGVMYAAGMSPWRMQELALTVRDIDVVDMASGNRRGMVSGYALQRLVNGYLNNKPIEALSRRFAAVCTDLSSGELVALAQGDAGAAVRSSCSIPGVFVPNQHAGRELVDGGLVSPLPIQTVRNLGADWVIAIDVGSRPSKSPRAGLYEIILQSFEIMGRALSTLEQQQADFLIQVDTDRFDSADFNKRKDLIEAGYLAGQRALPALRRLLAQANG